MSIRNRVKEMRMVPACDLKKNPGNWRTHPKAQQDALRGLLAEVGFAGAELCRELPDGSLMLIDGHCRAEIMGTNEVPCLILDVSEAEADKLLATFDPIGAMAGADRDKLDSLLREVQTESQDVAKMLEELGKQAGCEWAKEQQAIVEDEVPEPPVVPITQPGDLWLLGRHRLLCGDSTKAEDVARLMGGEKADLLHADPPYGMSLDTDYTRQGGREEGNRYMPVIGDDQPFDASRLVGSGPQEQLWWGADYYRSTIGEGGSWCAWDKWCGKLEPVGNGVELLWSKQPHKRRVYQHLWSGITAKERTERRVHPTQKPVALTAKVIEDHAPNADLVFDPFLGSGTTLIAAEQLGRRCFGMEISPLYCDVAVARWEKLTGKKATRQPKV